MTPALAALGVALLLSVGVNALQFSTIGELRERVGAAQKAGETSATTAKACRGRLKQLSKTQAAQKAANQNAIEAARLAGMEAGKKAEEERRRKQAVPGDACASAQVETDEWLRARQEGGGHGR